MKAYRVRNARITGATNWSGVVIADDEELVSEAIMKHHGLDYLLYKEYPEYCSRDYSVEEIPLESVSVCDLTVGELIGLLKHLN